MIEVYKFDGYTVVRDEDTLKEGLLNYKGEFVIPCNVDEILALPCEREDGELSSCWEEFGFIPIKNEGKWGFYFYDGKYVKPEFDDWIRTTEMQVIKGNKVYCISNNNHELEEISIFNSGWAEDPDEFEDVFERITGQKLSGDYDDFLEKND